LAQRRQRIHAQALWALHPLPAWMAASKVLLQVACWEWKRELENSVSLALSLGLLRQEPQAQHLLGWRLQVLEALVVRPLALGIFVDRLEEEPISCQRRLVLARASLGKSFQVRTWQAYCLRHQVEEEQREVLVLVICWQQLPILVASQSVLACLSQELVEQGVGILQWVLVLVVSLPCLASTSRQWFLPEEAAQVLLSMGIGHGQEGFALLEIVFAPAVQPILPMAERVVAFLEGLASWTYQWGLPALT
jgi:hypothetical protein